MKVRNTGVQLGSCARMNEVGYRDGGQQSDDGHHNHDFHKSEAALRLWLNTFFFALEFHKSILVELSGSRISTKYAGRISCSRVKTSFQDFNLFS
jgi:hypothetical protein